MDRFTTRRKATWQSKAPAWPFIAAAFVVAMVACWFAGPLFDGIVVGDGSEVGRLMVWLKTASNILLPAAAIGVAVGVALHLGYLSPAGRHSVMMWTGLLVLAAAVVNTPRNFQRGLEADRFGYQAALGGSAWQARTESRRAEQDMYRRLGLLMANDPFDPANLGQADGLDAARGAIEGHRDLVETARRDYPEGQAQARETLRKAVRGKMDREAVLERFDLAAGERRDHMEALWTAQDRIIALREEELRLLSANRGGWRVDQGQGVITDRTLLGRIRRIEAGLGEAFAESRAAQAALETLDYQTNAGIERVLAAAR